MEIQKSFYENYKAGYATDLTGAGSLEKTLGKALDEIDADWRAWVLAQKPPWTAVYRRKAHLGVKMEPSSDSVKVVGFVRNSAAQRAGRITTGDIIISVAGYPTPTSAALTAAVQSCQPGQTVDLEIIRNDRTVIIKHLLGLMPK